MKINIKKIMRKYLCKISYHKFIATGYLPTITTFECQRCGVQGISHMCDEGDICYVIPKQTK